MASKKTVTVKNLEALGTPRLAQLLVELAEADTGVKRRLRLELADTEGPGAVAHEIRKRLATIGKARSFIDWSKNAAFAADLDTQREMIVTKVAPRDPDAALDLMWRFMDLAESIYERCEDSSGRVGDIFRTACEDLCAIAAAAKPDPVAIANTAFDALCANDYAQFDELIPGLGPTLGETGLEHLKARMVAYSETKPKKAGKDAEQVIGWGSSSGYIRRGDIERTRIESTARLTLKQIADALGDVDAFIAQHGPEARKLPKVAAEIARRLLAAGRAQEALDAVEAANVRGLTLAQYEWEEAKLDALEALGRHEEAQAFRWSLFERRLDAGHLRAYLKRLPDFEDIEVEERAIGIARNWKDVNVGLHFLIGWPALDAAADLIVRRAGELNGDLYEFLSPAAEALSEKHPLAATLVLRAMIDFTLREARSSRYKHAARHLKACERLSSHVEDFGAAETQEAYRARLQAEHGRKRGFWSLVD